MQDEKYYKKAKADALHILNTLKYRARHTNIFIDIYICNLQRDLLITDVKEKKKLLSFTCKLAYRPKIHFSP